MTVWSWSLLQFTVVQTMANTPKSLNDASKSESKNESIADGNKIHEPHEEKKNQIPLHNIRVLEASNNNIDTNEQTRNIENETAENANQTKVIVIGTYNDADQAKYITAEKGRGNFSNYFCFHNEIWPLVLSVVFQDAPFLAVRLYIMIVIGFVEYDVIYFTTKNIFVILLVINRVRIICYSKKKSTNA